MAGADDDTSKGIGYRQLAAGRPGGGGGDSGSGSGSGNEGGSRCRHSYDDDTPSTGSVFALPFGMTHTTSPPAPPPPPPPVAPLPARPLTHSLDSGIGARAGKNSDGDYQRGLRSSSASSANRSSEGGSGSGTGSGSGSGSLMMRAQQMIDKEEKSRVGRSIGDRGKGGEGGAGDDKENASYDRGNTGGRAGRVGASVDGGIRVGGVGGDIGAETVTARRSEGDLAAKNASRGLDVVEPSYPKRVERKPLRHVSRSPSPAPVPDDSSLAKQRFERLQTMYQKVTTGRLSWQDSDSDESA